MTEQESSGPQEILAMIIFCIICIPMSVALLLVYGNGELPTSRQFLQNLTDTIRGWRRE